MTINEQPHQPDLGIETDGRTVSQPARSGGNPGSKEVLAVLAETLDSLAKLTRELADSHNTGTEREELATSLSPAQRATEEAAEPPATEPLNDAGTRPTKYAPKVSFYQDREDTDRVRGTILHTMHREKSRTLSEFIHNAVMEKVEELERKYNDGKPFPHTKAGELPQGRPWRR